MMGNFAQQCVNDPPRTDFHTATVFTPQPTGGVTIHPLPHPIPAPVVSPVITQALQTAIGQLTSATVDCARALSATTTTIERFQGARTAKEAGQAGGLHGLAVQGQALTHNSGACASQLTAVASAASSVASSWASAVSPIVERINSSTGAQLGQAVTSSWQNARTQMQSSFGVSAGDLATLDSQVSQLAAHLTSGAITSNGVSWRLDVVCAGGQHVFPVARASIHCSGTTEMS